MSLEWFSRSFQNTVLFHRLFIDIQLYFSLCWSKPLYSSCDSLFTAFSTYHSRTSLISTLTGGDYYATQTRNGRQVLLDIYEMGSKNMISQGVLVWLISQNWAVGGIIKPIQSVLLHWWNWVVENEKILRKPLVADLHSKSCLVFFVHGLQEMPVLLYKASSVYQMVDIIKNSHSMWRLLWKRKSIHPRFLKSSRLCGLQFSPLSLRLWGHVYQI